MSAPDATPADTETETTPEDTSSTKTVREYKGTGIMWGAVGLVLLLVAFIVVVLQNAQNVDFDFLWITVTTPLSLIIAITTAASLAVGELIGFVWRRRRRSDLQRREELRQLRSK